MQGPSSCLHDKGQSSIFECHNTFVLSKYLLLMGLQNLGEWVLRSSICYSNSLPVTCGVFVRLSVGKADFL